MVGAMPPDVLAFVLTSLIVELTPGPNMATLAVLAATRGRAAGLAAVAGVALGLAVVGTLAALGLAALVQASPTAWEVLRWGGAAYLLWLAVDTWRDADAEPGFTADGTLARAFRDGLVINLLNPKAAVFYVAVLPGFLPPGAGPTLTIGYALIYVAVATAVHAGIVLLAGAAVRWLAEGRRRRAAARLFAVLLAGIAVWLVIATAR